MCFYPVVIPYLIGYWALEIIMYNSEDYSDDDYSDEDVDYEESSEQSEEQSEEAEDSEEDVSSEEDSEEIESEEELPSNSIRSRPVTGTTQLRSTSTLGSRTAVMPVSTLRGRSTVTAPSTLRGRSTVTAPSTSVSTLRGRSTVTAPSTSVSTTVDASKRPVQQRTKTTSTRTKTQVRTVKRTSDKTLVGVGNVARMYLRIASQGNGTVTEITTESLTSILPIEAAVISTISEPIYSTDMKVYITQLIEYNTYRYGCRYDSKGV